MRRHRNRYEDDVEAAGRPTASDPLRQSPDSGATGVGQSEYGMMMNADGSDQRVFDSRGLRPEIWSPGRGIDRFNGYPLSIFDLTTGRTRDIPYEP